MEREIIQDAATMRQNFHSLIQSIDEGVDIRKMKRKKNQLKLQEEKHYSFE